MSEAPSETVRRKDAYHHGDLRQALVNATRQLVIEKGAENFTLADACRLAGVSTAAPYKHFRDKNEILQEIIMQGFDAMSESRRQAIAPHGAATLDGMIACGTSYVAFAIAEPAIFRLMFGQNPQLKSAEHVQAHGRACFSGVIEDVATFCAANGIKGDARLIALELWTFVHGVASLTIDQDYEKVAPGLDVLGLIADSAPRLLGLAGR